ncbi:hypothetical protein PR202_gb28807 [Eleusine coracana subsp. coracana]|uniref:RING-type domain-containing protein n=1 Tax=Eleusine coracana subsp. coracana TaxID=191504 RepID=A0AAV5FVE7_ELECO|nr:hypothetical protein PR202_gb28807 [Eleusine coracana subsp. coracana]
MTAAAAWPVCTICYEDLRPLSDQHIYSLPSCGHVFHALCLEQWLEYCPGGKKKGTCPICKHPCGAAHPPTRLFFQSTGACPTQACPSSQNASKGADPEELAAEVTRLEQKAVSLARIIEEQRDGIKKLNAEASAADCFSRSVSRWREQAATAEAMRESARKEKDYAQVLLNVKTEELSRKTAECGRLQQKSLALAKELAALKLSSDMNLQEEEILKLASLGNHGNLENAVDVLKRSLAIRNKSYKELMIQCNVLGRSESRTQQKLEKAKELVKKLKTRVHELEKELEEKENSLIRDLRSSKKMKVDEPKSWSITDNSGFRNPSSGYGNEAVLDEVMEDPCSVKPHSDNLKHEGMSDLKAEGNLGKKDVIDLDADDSIFRNEQKAGFSAKLFQISDDDFETPKILGADGTRKSIGKWCKGSTALGSASTNINRGNLIAVGPDGRGGSVKILRDLGRFQDSKSPALWPKAPKVGGKAGQSQIDHFFGKR